MPDLLEFIKIYRDFGFLGLYLVVTFFFYRELKSRNAESVDMVIKVTQALDRSTETNEDSNDIHRDVRKSIDENKQNNQNFIEFLKGRDDGRRS